MTTETIQKIKYALQSAFGEEIFDFVVCFETTDEIRAVRNGGLRNQAHLTAILTADLHGALRGEAE